MNFLLFSLGRLWLKTLRIHWVFPQKIPSEAVIVLWHEHLPACIRVFSHLGIAVLISKSPDGEWAAKACQNFGYQVFRGSTTQGGMAGMKALSREIKTSGKRAGMALDGPKGPRHQVQPGSLWLAKTHKIPIVPVYLGMKHAFRLTTWDRCQIPLPFSKIEVLLGPPIYPQKKEEIEEAMRALEHSDSHRDIYIAKSQST